MLMQCSDERFAARCPPLLSGTRRRGIYGKSFRLNRSRMAQWYALRNTTNRQFLWPYSTCYMLLAMRTPSHSVFTFTIVPMALFIVQTLISLLKDRFLLAAVLHPLQWLHTTTPRPGKLVVSTSFEAAFDCLASRVRILRRWGLTIGCKIGMSDIIVVCTMF